MYIRMARVFRRLSILFMLCKPSDQVTVFDVSVCRLFFGTTYLVPIDGHSEAATGLWLVGWSLTYLLDSSMVSPERLRYV
jgi:hypothetical protein